MSRLTATGAIALATVTVSVVVMLAPETIDVPMRAGFIPARLSGVETDYAAIPTWLTPLSSAFVHAGVLHLFSNLLILLFTGWQCERAVGARGIAILYLVGAYAAAFAQWLPEPMAITPMVGASGAASAVFGAYSLLFARSRAIALGPIPALAIQALWLAAAWAGVNLLAAYALRLEGIAIAAAAHIGGFVAGLVLARPLLKWRWRRT
ncbi:rhomboid family intramembrane serine protease [Sphingomonas sp. LM7]|uniref:rhomboid family intramembrane serine protease n=1 Tax=Sphingomonas sp. LM7 TaxID=1938607 RepID=UPI000983ED7D|nr:rhomboid family intramembrane serine protease [Sphingomonas sp. LM7]AQR73214.1 rhomboid family intramembrane serine protease [Sphingomonas sp. LM7]